MRDTVTLKELAAIVVRRGRLTIILALICALALGGKAAYTQFEQSRDEENSPEKIEERYLKALEEYEKEQDNLREQISRTEEQLESQKTYNAHTLLLDIDFHNKAVTTINLAITDVDEGAFQQVFRLENTPIDFIISKIQSQYMILWNSLDLQSALDDVPYEDLDDKYLREVVTLSRMDGGGLTLVAVAASEMASKQLADAAYQCLLESQPIIAGGSYGHTFTLLSEVTKVLIDSNLESTQQSCFDKIENYEANIENLTKQLEELKKPERETEISISVMAKSVVKYAVLGIAAGLLLGLTYSMISYIFRNRAETSRQISQTFSLTFLGSVVKPSDLWNQLANKILDERLWPDAGQALSFISANAKVMLPESGVVLLASTLPLTEEGVQAVIQALSTETRTVLFVGAANHNPETADALCSCSCVVLAERAGNTKWEDIEELIALAKNLRKPVNGFVMV